MEKRCNELALDKSTQIEFLLGGRGAAERGGALGQCQGLVQEVTRCPGLARTLRGQPGTGFALVPQLGCRDPQMV